MVLEPERVLEHRGGGGAAESELSGLLLQSNKLDPQITRKVLVFFYIFF